MQPKVSIVIPVYNVEQYLDRCVQSVLSQTLQDFEIILVDDGSPDNCPAMCDAYAKSDNRITVVHKANAGLGMACNSGIEVAQGKYIAFLDSDDWVDTEMYQTMYDAAEKYSADMVFSGLKRVDETGKSSILSQPSQLFIASDQEAIHSIMLDMIANPPRVRMERNIAMSAKVVLYSNDLIKSNHIRFESERQYLSEDLIFNIDCLRAARTVALLPATYYNYFINTQSLSNTIRKDRFYKNIDLREKMLQRYAPISPRLMERINRMTIGYCRNTIAAVCNAPNISYSEKIEILQGYVKHPIWKILRKDYPIHLMPLVHRIYFMAAFFNKKSVLYILSKLNK